MEVELDRILLMTDLTTITANTIASLAFQEFIKSSTGELAKKFTAEAIAKINDLRKLLWARLHGKHEIAEKALQQAENGDQKAIETIGTLLGVEMLDPAFASEVRAIAQEINIGRLQDKSTMIQNISGTNARVWQTKVEGGTAYIGEIHQHNPETKPN